MTQEQYQAEYEAIEQAVEIGAMTWRQGMAKASMLALRFAQTQYQFLDRKAAE